MGKRGGPRGGKTNAMRLLEAAGVAYEVHEVDADATKSGAELAALAGEDGDRVFKTLVTVGKSGEHYVFMVPVACELDLKKAASVSGEKSVSMVHAKELLGLTGYVHGGCSPLGMKKLFPTFIDETCVLHETIFFSAGRVGLQIETSFEGLSKAVPVTPADVTM